MNFSVPIRRAETRSSAFLDVLFILLITFFLVTTLTDEEAHEAQPTRVEVKLPVLEHNEGPAQAGTKDEIRLALTADGSLHLGDQELGTGRDARSKLERALRERLGAGAPPAVRLMTDEGARAEHFLPLVALLRELGIARIDLLGTEDEESAGGVSR